MTVTNLGSRPTRILIHLGCIGIILSQKCVKVVPVILTDTVGVLERSSLFVHASLLGPGRWDNSERPSAQGVGLSQLHQVGAAQAEMARSPAGRLLEGSHGHL